jgi:hypothetical protein
MIRLATEQDIPVLVRGMLQLRQQTAWASVEGDYSDVSLRQFLTLRLRAIDSVCYLWDDPVDACCGITLNTMFHPPYLPYVHEWAWWGAPRPAVQCWHACLEWGRRQGAVYSLRVQSQPGPATSVHELAIWEKL